MHINFVHTVCVELDNVLIGVQGLFTAQSTSAVSDMHEMYLGGVSNM